MSLPRSVLQRGKGSGHPIPYSTPGLVCLCRTFRSDRTVYTYVYVSTHVYMHLRNEFIW